MAASFAFRDWAAAAAGGEPLGQLYGVAPQRQLHRSQDRLPLLEGAAEQRVAVYEEQIEDQVADNKPPSLLG